MRKRFGVYIGASTIYPLLSFLEEQGLLKSQWSTHLIGKVERPCKVFTITEDGRDAAIALASTVQAVLRFEGHILHDPQKPERYNIITLQ
jgi:DNA-binding PadR family transcriptional regulator